MRGLHDGPRAACASVSDVRVVSVVGSSQGGHANESDGPAAARGGIAGGTCAPPPARFARLLEAEARVCARLADEQRAASGEPDGAPLAYPLPPELARELLLEEGEDVEGEAEEGEEATAIDLDEGSESDDHDHHAAPGSGEEEQ